jgi:hypothetical protein
MTLDQLLAMIMSSSPGEWLWNDERGIWTFTRDLHVRIVAKKQRSQRSFQEAWAQDFPDPRAYLCIFELWYGATFVKEYPFVAVDGYRAYLPVPRSQGDMSVSKEQYLVAGILNMPSGGPHPGYFESYIARFRID